MKSADDDEGVFGTTVPFPRRSEEQMKVFGFYEVVEIFLSHFLGSFFSPLIFFTVPIKLSDFPIFNHERTLLPFVILEAIREFIGKLGHELEVFEILIFEQVGLLEAVKDCIDLILGPLGICVLNDEVDNFGGFKNDERKLV